MASLKSFIKAVRKAKTIADERNVIKKESASIRTSFKDANLDQNTRRVNISKLLYLYIIGEKTHFGQVECIKLLASGRFVDKRLGYLATMLLLDENQEVLTLLTNSLDNDMNNSNPYIIGQALCCLGNIASVELSRDLYANVERLIKSNNPYVKKKAIIVSSKLIDKNPELIEFFIGFLPALVTDKLANVVLASLKLIQSIFTQTDDIEDRNKVVKLAPNLISHLRKLINSGYNPDYDVLGINDPFLIVNLIGTIRLLTTHSLFSPKDLEAVNDTLTSICSNIEIGKNVGHSILYESIKTIFKIKSEQSLKILGINLLGKFLSTKDNNTRYVALNTLLTVINIEPNSVQRHRSIIINCLNDGDISIRRRALELSFAIINESNIRIIIKEIISYLNSTTDNDLKPYIISQLIYSIERYSPNDSWKFDNLVKILSSANNYIKLEYVNQILGLIIGIPVDLKKLIILRLLALTYDNFNVNKFGLVLVTVWTVGEYFELLNNEPLPSGSSGSASSGSPVTESSVLALFTSILNNSNYSPAEIDTLTTYVLNSLIKLSAKFTHNDSLNHIKLILESHLTDSNLEIQLRATEYLGILHQDLKLRKGLLSKMPAPTLKQLETVSLSERKPEKTPHAQQPEPVVDLLDFEEKEPKANVDLLSLFDSAPQKDDSVLADSVLAYTDDTIEIRFAVKSIANGQGTIESIIKSHTTEQIANFQLLIAVPKSQKLSISSNSKTLLSGPNDTIVQHIKLSGKEGSKIKFRIKFNYVLGATPVDHTFDHALDKTL